MRVIRKLSRLAFYVGLVNAATDRLLRRLDPIGADDVAPADDLGVHQVCGRLG
jgi:hypothetical protein